MHTRKAITEALQKLGVQTGDLLMVHASLKAIGPVEGGAETVVAALRSAVGPAGTVMGRAGRVKSRSVQTFPHFAGRPVENRGRAGDRKKPAVPVEQPVLNRQTQALWLAASMASIIAARTPASSMARMPRMVVPPGEQTLSLSAPGCRPLSSSILPAPITVWAASS